jgi:hypothetical protein
MWRIAHETKSGVFPADPLSGEILSTTIL